MSLSLDDLMMQQVDEKSGSLCPGNVVAALTDQELGYASQASTEFGKNNFDSCLAALNKLKFARSFDLKILSNHAVAEYYQSGLTKTDQFNAAVQELRLKINSDESSNVTEDEEYCYIYYNYAVVLFHSRQYSSAMTTMERVWYCRENLDEVIFGKIVCLLVDLYITTYQPYEALGLIDVFESEVSSKYATNSESNSDPMPDKYNNMLVQQKLKCYIMLGSIECAKKEVKLLTQNSPSSHILKAYFELSKQNYKRSTYLLNSCMSSWKKTNYINVCCNNNIGVNYFKEQKFNLAHLHFVKAIEESSLLWQSYESANESSSGPPLEIMGSRRHHELLYNMGVTLLQCGQPQMAFDCLLNVVQAYPFNPRLWLRLAECCTQVHKKSNDEDCQLPKKMEILSRYAGSSVHRKGILGRGVHPPKMSTNDSGAIPVPTMEFASLCLENALNCLDNSIESMCLENEDVKNRCDGIPNSPLFIFVAPSNPIREDEINNLRCSILTLKAYLALHHKNYLVALNSVDALFQLPSLNGVQKYLAQMYKAEALMGLDRTLEGISLLSSEDNVDPGTFAAEKTEGIQSDADSEGDLKNEAELPRPRNSSSRNWYPYTADQAEALRLHNSAVLCTVARDYGRAESLHEQSLKLQHSAQFAQMHYLKVYLKLLDGRRSTNGSQARPCIWSLLNK